MSKILDLTAFRKSKSGQTYTENLSKMNLLDLTQETINMGRILKSKGHNLSKEEKMKAKTLFEYCKTVFEKDSSMGQTIDSLIKYYDLG